MRELTVLHLFSGIGGCTRGMQVAGFKSVGSVDIDGRAIEQLKRWTGTPGYVADIAAMQPADLLALVPRSPDLLIMSPPCKSFSGCMPASRAGEERYVDMSQLAVRATFLALETWPTPPGLILIENVPRIRTRGAPLLEQIVKTLQRYGYETNQDTHNCREIGGGPQDRVRFLLVARHRERVPDFWRKPPKQAGMTVGDALLHLPSPVAAHGDPMHALPLLSPLNWLRLAAIRAGRDWRDLPAAIRLGGDATARHSGILGVEGADAPAHTVTGNARTMGTWGGVADPRVAWDRSTHKGRPDSFGVERLDRPAHTIRGRQEVQTSRRSVVDPRLAERAGRQNGGFGVEAADRPAHAVLAEGTTRNTRASVADPRLTCSPRAGAYGVQDPGEAAGAVLGHHSHDNAAGSLADPRLAHEPHRGAYGVVELVGAAPTVRGHQDVRQAPGAVVDARGWPVATHVLAVEGDELVLYGPAIDLTSKRPCLLVIETFVDDPTAERGVWHRPMTPRELFSLQDGDESFVVEGPRSSSKTQAGIIEWIGNMIPVRTATAIGLAAKACLLSTQSAGFLRGQDVWVAPKKEQAPSPAPEHAGEPAV